MKYLKSLLRMGTDLMVGCQVLRWMLWVWDIVAHRGNLPVVMELRIKRGFFLLPDSRVPVLK